MKIAFCLFKYFPYGGLQRDFLRIAKLCVKRGHKVIVYTMDWQGDMPSEFDIRIVEVNGRSNHSKCLHFAEQVNKSLAQTPVDLVIGFNKMPGLDMYYCADNCYITKVNQQKSKFIKLFYKLFNRFRYFHKLEQQTFVDDTKILFISKNEQKNYHAEYPIASENSILLPPNINKKRFQPILDSKEKFNIKNRIARELHINRDNKWLLMVGSGFKTKGVDRSIVLLKYLLSKNINTNLIVIGQDNPITFIRLARYYGVHKNVKFLSGREDIADFMAAADLLVHPAYRENTGTVILESIVMGLPVVASCICGYAEYIDNSGCGLVVCEPFIQKDFNTKVLRVLEDGYMLKNMSDNGINFARSADIYNADDKIIELIEHA